MRIERDPLGEMEVPAAAYYGIQTARALENFPISGLRAPGELVDGDRAGQAGGRRSQRRARTARRRRSPHAIVAAADEVLGGALRDQFVVDVYQAGAGTSHNMNANEVLANLAAELLGGRAATTRRVHPNDHVNMGQSTNDVFPTATRLALLLRIEQLIAAARALARALDEKADAFARRAEDGPHAPAGRGADDARTGVRRAMRLRRAAAPTTSSTRATALRELNLGATAVGTGLNAGADYAERAIAQLRATTGFELRAGRESISASRRAWATSLAFSGAVRRLAVEVGKIASDLRLLSMGPRAGLVGDRRCRRCSPARRSCRAR